MRSWSERGDENNNDTGATIEDPHRDEDSHDPNRGPL
jgi:hypothetical protein